MKNKEGNEYNIICFSNIDWDFIFQRPQQLMAAFSNEKYIDKIIYIETLGARKVKLNKEDSIRVIKKLFSFFTRKTKSKIYDKENAYSNIYVLSPKVIPIMNNLFYIINKWLLSHQLNKLMKKKGIQASNTIAWVNLSHPVVYEIIKKRQFNEIVYDCIDDIKSIPSMHLDIINYELKFIKEADIVFATSQLLYKMCKKYNNNVKLLPNAVPRNWIKRGKSKGKDSFKTKTVGYVGTIYEWFDLDILYKCVSTFDDVQFVIIGPVRVDISRFRDFSNITFTGKVEYPRVEIYIESFDVCLIPFKINELTEHTDPVKVYEYFAKGKPVVTTYLPELYKYKECLYYAKDKQDFVEYLRMALREQDKDLTQRRIEIAQENTWEERIKTASKEAFKCSLL